MTMSNARAQPRRLPWRTIVAVTWRLKIARLLLWLVRERHDSVLVPIVRRIVESAERLAGVTD
jgi:hypothetical protein